MRSEPTTTVDDLWRAWAQAQPDGDRAVLASDLAVALIEHPRAADDLVALDRLVADLDRLDEPGVNGTTVRIARGLARLTRHQLADVHEDRATGMALLRSGCAAAQDDTPLLGLALPMVAAMSAEDDAQEALAAIDRLQRVNGPNRQNPAMDRLEVALLYQRYHEARDPAVADAALRRLDQVCAESPELPSDALLMCGELHVLRTVGHLLGPDHLPDIDTAIGVLERGLPHAEGPLAAVGLLLLGTAYNRHATITSDDRGRGRAIDCLDEALHRGGHDADLALIAHQERLDALLGRLGDRATQVPPALDAAVAEARAALALHPHAGSGNRAEVAMQIARAESQALDIRGDLDIGSLDRIRENLDLAACHPNLPAEWSTKIAALRASVQHKMEFLGHSTGDAGVSLLVDALRDTRQPERVRRMLGNQLVAGPGIHGALHELESGAALLRSADAQPFDRVLAAVADIEIVRRRTRDDSQILAAIDRALVAAKAVDPESGDGRLIAQALLPFLEAMREAGRPSGRPFDELQASTLVGDTAALVRDTLEISRAVALVKAAAADPAHERTELRALEKRVARLPSGRARAVGAGALLILWVTRAARDQDPEAAARATIWVPEAMENVGGPEHPLYARTARNAAIAYRIRARGGDRRRSRELALAALRGQAWMVLLQSGSEHALVLAREASADAVRLARWCLADRAADELVAALDAGRGLVLQAAVTSRGITDQLRAAGAHDLADEWVATGGDDRLDLAAMPGVDLSGVDLPRRPASTRVDCQRRLVQVDLPSVDLPGVDLSGVDLPGVDLHSDLRRRVLLALGADPAAGTSSMAQVQRTLAAARADALVYLVPADDAGPGLAVVVPARGSLEVLQLPHLHADTAAALAGGVTGTRRGVTGTGRDVTEPDAGPGAPAAAPVGPGPMMEWAWRVAGSALADRLRPAADRLARLVLVPFGPLALVPWHAARPADGAGMLDRAIVSYAPSAHLLGSALAQPRHRDGGVLVLGNPTGDLREAGVEARALVGVFYPAATYLGRTDRGGAEPSGPGAAAEMLALLGADAPPLALLHLACHARANRTAPWRSSLVLADRPVDVGELLTLRRSTPLEVDTVCLAGCSTNVAGTDHDEAFSLASAFLAAGARTAFGSMWTVPDDHTSRLMFMVHHFLARGDDAADALHQAQLWAADPGRIPPPEMPTALARGASGPDDPVAWAGFQHVGA